MAEGPVASKPFASLEAPQPEHQANFVRFDLPPAYLALNSVSLQPLLGSLFNNSLFANNSTAATDCQSSCATFCSTHLFLCGWMRWRVVVSRLRFKPGDAGCW